MVQNLIKKTKKTKPIVKYEKGTVSKKSMTFLKIMKEQFGFEPAQEFISFYSDTKHLYEELYLTYTDKKKRRRMPQVDIDMFWKLRADINSALITFMKFSFPTLRSQEIKGPIGDRPIFNITLGVPPEPEIKNVTPIMDATTGGNKDGSF